MGKTPGPALECPASIVADLRAKWATIAEADGPDVATKRILKLQQERGDDIPYGEDSKPRERARTIVPVSAYQALSRLRVNDDRTKGALKQTWHPGTKPGDLPIDVFIERMLQSRSLRAKRLKERVQTGAVRCPYYSARLGLYLAVCMSEMAAPTEASVAAGKKYLKRKQHEAEKALAAIETFVSDLTSNAFAPMINRRSSRYNFSRLNRALSDAAAAADVCRATPAAIAKLLKLAERERRRLPAEPNANHWARGFTEGMGRPWTDIFGEEPTHKSKAFVRFVTEGYASLVDDPGPWDWETQVKDVIRKVEKRDHRNRFKRHFDESYPREFTPLGTTFTTPDESRVRRDKASARPANDNKQKSSE